MNQLPSYPTLIWCSPQKLAKGRNLSSKGGILRIVSSQPGWRSPDTPVYRCLREPNPWWRIHQFMISAKVKGMGRSSWALLFRTPGLIWNLRFFPVCQNNPRTKIWIYLPNDPHYLQSKSRFLTIWAPKSASTFPSPFWRLMKNRKDTGSKLQIGYFNYFLAYVSGHKQVFLLLISWIEL